MNSCTQKSPCVIIIRDTEKYIFGAYCSDYLHI
ncbi:MAG: TLD domain-containing protein [bacterium]